MGVAGSGLRPAQVFGLVRGRVTLRTDGAPTMVLEAGDVAVLNGRTSVELHGGPETSRAQVVRLPDGPSAPIDLRGAGPGGDVLLGGHVDLDDLCRTWLLDVLPPVGHGPGSSAPAAAMRRELELLLAEATSGRGRAAFSKRQWAQLLLLEVLRGLGRGTSLPPGWLRAVTAERLRPAVGLIHSDPGADRSLRELADAARMSRTTFASRFRAVAGTPPLAYVARWRMPLARRALRDEETTMAALAARLGHQSASSFSSAFKREVGLSPSHYRLLDRAREAPQADGTG